jgi:non-canonical purine NTP pyrophosphatase (RdgB/HAM1 family)
MPVKKDNLILGSSNQSKIKEYQEFGLNIKTMTIPDLKEVNGDEIQVIIHKTKDLNQENVILEDSTLTVENADIGVNTKWLIHELKNNPLYNGRYAEWIIYLGLLQDNKVYVFQAKIKGKICQKNKNDLAFGFDSVFVPENSNKTLYELKLEGKKEQFSARKNAILKLLNDKPDIIMNLCDIQKWDGSYQNE